MTIFDPPLGTPAEEAALCRKAWKAHPGNWGWHIHHGKLAEERTCAISERIAYILSDKPLAERALRLRLLRPVLDAATEEAWKAYDAAMTEAWKAYDAAMVEPRKAYDAAVAEPQKAYDAAMKEAQKAYYAARAEAWKAYDAAIAESHTKECPGCPWNGTDIFGGAK